MASRDTNRIGVALARFWHSGSGPTRDQTLLAMRVGGVADAEATEGNKEHLVHSVVMRAEEPVARNVIEELVGVLKRDRYLDVVPAFGGSLEFALKAHGHPLTVDGYNAAVVAGDHLRVEMEKAGHKLTSDGRVEWGDVAPVSPPAVAQAVTAATAVTATRGQEASPQSLDLLLSVLRRLGEGALRPLITRRRQRSGITISDEYDLQDAVEAILMTLYADVRCEEPTPSSAGSSSRMDLLLADAGIAVEVKVTRPRRAELEIKSEILRDANDYRGHATVRVLVVVVYDLVHSFKNRVGFEADMSRSHDGLDVRVVVVSWAGPGPGRNGRNGRNRSEGRPI